MPKTKNRKVSQTNVRIDFEDKAILDKIAKETGESSPKILHKAIDQLKRKMFFEQVNRVSREIRENDPELLAFEDAECEMFDKASANDLKSL